MSTEGDIVLIYHMNEPGVYARIEEIRPDIKKDWYQVTLTLLTIPPQEITWILRAEYIDGAPYTMGGHEMRMELLERRPQPDTSRKDKTATLNVKKNKREKSGKVVTFRKKDPS
jgi:hypothetical protein